MTAYFSGTGLLFFKANFLVGCINRPPVTHAQNVLGMTLNCLAHHFPAPALIKECLLVSVLGLMCACAADAHVSPWSGSVQEMSESLLLRASPSRATIPVSVKRANTRPRGTGVGARQFLVFRPAPLHTKRWLTFYGYLPNSKA
ncbi:hypothetical protein J6590_105193, partial [Homalodisca vitripennis]